MSTENKNRGDQLISKDQATQSIKTLLQYIGDDVSREGLLDTPNRVIKSYNEIFSGYNTSPNEVLQKRFFETSKFEGFIWLKNIEFCSICEHHMLPISGFVDICYVPECSVVGLSKLARLVDVFARRLQLQERMTAQIANSIQEYLSPKGVGVRVKATHYCLKMRGALKSQSEMETVHFTGVFDKNFDKNDALSYQKTFYQNL